jgi:hypothetical protein
MSPEAVATQQAVGYALYEEKPTLQKGHGGAVAGARPLGTWSDAEYALPGFQWMYLRYKSWQRFAETWALLERAAAAGLFRPGVGPLDPATHARVAATEGAGAAASGQRRPLRVVSLGGGPGFELLAFDWFARLEAAVPSYAQPTKSSARSSGEDATDADATLRDPQELHALREAWLSARCRAAPEEVAAADPRACPGLLQGGPAQPKATASGEGVAFVSLDLQPGWRPYVDELG